ncbi:MAG: molybdopterin molybdotransferase MoeA [Gammaproteobacteria bacterium]|nr:molybdopterin molybdotransferase MoeA [Gammaproteobacteria bacterium]MDE0272701.1 molybdopterin molybdotransferase MoeA [Gammaproteobacteria bacterium]
MSLPTPLDLDAARQRILARIPAPEAVERIALDRALGRVAAEDSLARTDLPPFNASAMDGYAFRWRPGLTRLRVVGASLAGHPFNSQVPDGAAVRITTGAALPGDCDTVVIQEDCALSDTALSLNSVPSRGGNVRLRGHDLRQGDVVAARGRRLNAFDIGTLAAAGVDAATVFARPRIAVFSSGDELQRPGTPLTYGNIYDSNRYAVAGLLSQLPVAVRNLGVLADDASAIADALTEASAECALILTSGGVSVGDADLVKSTLERLGELDFWRLNLKPGKPLAFGRIGRARLMGLPGNPVSTIVTYLLLAKPAVEALCGMAPQEPLILRCQLTQAVRHKAGREEYLRGTATTAQRPAQVTPTGDQSSNRMSTFAAANCLIRIPKSDGDLPAGAWVEVLPLTGLVS